MYTILHYTVQLYNGGHLVQTTYISSVQHLYSTVEAVSAATIGKLFSIGLSASESTRLGEGGIFITELNSAPHFLANISDAFPK